MRWMVSAILGCCLCLNVGCSKNVEETPAYQAACHGSPLRSLEQREEAQEIGYVINQQYRCIDKASYEAVEKQRALWEAANSPEGIAKRQAEFAAQREQGRLEQELRRQREETAEPERIPEVNLIAVDVNTATEAEIDNVISISSATAAQIVQEREKRAFADWEDLVYRVVGLSQAQPAMFASVCGLTVNGKSLEGAPPNRIVAARIDQQTEQGR